MRVCWLRCPDTFAAIALIIDEAQHALTSEAGESAIAALKYARDQLNAPGIVNLMLVMSGSDRDKLLRLVNANGAPFDGAMITRMPALDKDYVDYQIGTGRMRHRRCPDAAVVSQTPRSGYLAANERS